MFVLLYRCVGVGVGVGVGAGENRDRFLPIFFRLRADPIRCSVRRSDGRRRFPDCRENAAAAFCLTSEKEKKDEKNRDMKRREMSS